MQNRITIPQGPNLESTGAMNVWHDAPPHELFLLFLALLAGAVGLVGALGAVTALAGDTLRAIPGFVLVPLYLMVRMLRWKIVEGGVDPLALGGVLAWLVGVTIGCIAWYANVALRGI